MTPLFEKRSYGYMIYIEARITFGIILFVFALTAYSSLLCANAGNMNVETTFEEPSIFNQVDLLKRSRRGRMSINLLKEFLEENRSDSSSASYLRAQNELADQYRWLKEYDNAALMLSLVESRIIDDLQMPISEVIRYRLYKGKLYRSLRILDSAEYQLRQALEVTKTHNMQNTALEGQIWGELGIIYFYYHENIAQGIDYFKKNLRIFQQVLSQSDVNLGSLYYEFALINRSLGDFERAANFARMAEITYHGLGSDFENNRLNCLIVQANCLFDDNRFEEASNIYENAIRIFQTSVTPRNDALFAAHLNNGTALYNLGRYGKAADNLYGSLKLNPSGSRRDSVNLISNYIDLALVTEELGDFEKAERYLNHALRISIALYEKKHFELSDCYRYLALHYEKRAELDKALTYFQKSLITGFKGFESENIDKNPSSFDSIPIGSALYLLFDKARILKKRYSVNESMKDLELAFQLYRAAYDLIVQSPESSLMEQTLLNLSENFDKEFDNGVECVLSLYHLTNDKVYLDYLLIFIETNKYLLLNSSINKSTHKQTLGLPDSAYQKEKNLLATINEIKKEILETAYNSDDDELNRRVDLFQAIHEWEDVRKRWSKLTKVESSKSGVLNPITLNQVKDEVLGKGDLLLEYFSVGDSLFCLAVSQQFDTIFSRSIDTELVHMRDQYLNHLFNKDVLSDQDSYERFVENAYFLFQKVVEPALSKIRSPNSNIEIKRIIVVPDDLLSIVPFESLIQEGRSQEYINYYNLEYLCKDYIFNYAYSSNILYDNIIGAEQERNQGILAFSYSSADESESESNKRHGLDDLPYSAVELSNIGKWMPEGDFFEGESATEVNFKMNAQDFGIIHLALHGIGDTVDMLSSRIIFNDSGGGKEDGILFAHELYGMDLSRSNMAVLSACETGIGKMMQGEGLYSLARGFAYAGCPSLIMSFWKVNDETTAQLMDYFYESLSKGAPKDVALQQAKLKYIRNSDDISAHPSNWAAFISVGDTSPIEFQNNQSRWYLILIFIAAFVIFYLWRKFQHR